MSGPPQAASIEAAIATRASVRFIRGATATCAPARKRLVSHGCGRVECGTESPFVQQMDSDLRPFGHMRTALRVAATQGAHRFNDWGYACRERRRASDSSWWTRLRPTA